MTLRIRQILNVGLIFNCKKDLIIFSPFFYQSFLVYLFAILFCANVGVAQDKAIAQFETKTHDFGTINEADGSVIYNFTFTNTGTVPLIISRVKPSCGCTTPNWSREPVMPGEQGLVSAKYNPNNRPGAFRKSLTISSNASERIISLYITGKVLPKVKTLEEKYVVKLGNVRFESKNINFGRMKSQETKEMSIGIYNDSDELIQLSNHVTAPDFIKVSFATPSLKPKEEGKIMIRYDANHDANLGFNSHSILIATDEQIDSQKELHVMASITEFFPELSDEEIANAPTLNIENRIFDFGKIKQGNVYETEFLLTNNGNSALNIRKIKSNCACVTATLDTYDIQSKTTTKLKIRFDTSKRRGSQIKNITIYSNDPNDPTQLVTIKGNVIVE